MIMNILLGLWINALYLCIKIVLRPHALKKFIFYSRREIYILRIYGTMEEDHFGHSSQEWKGRRAGSHRGFRLCSVHSFEKVFQVFEAVVLFTQDAVGPLPPATATQHQSDKLSFKILCFCPKFHLEKELLALKNV